MMVPARMVRDRVFGSTTEKAIVAAFAEHADDDGDSIYPSIKTVADDTGVHERTVQRIVTKYREDGLLVLTAEARQHRPRTYRIDLDVLAEYPLTATGQKRLERQQQRARPGPFRGDTTPPLASKGYSARGDTDAVRGDIDEPRGDIACHPTYRVRPTDIDQTRARAREGSGSDGPPSPRDASNPKPETNDAGKADGDAEQPEPACAAWRAAVPAIIEAVGFEVYRSWIVHLTPLSDDGQTMVIGTLNSPMCLNFIEERRPVLEAAVGRRIQLKRWLPCDAAAAQRIKAGGWSGELWARAGPSNGENQRGRSACDVAPVSGSENVATPATAAATEVSEVNTEASNG